MQVPDRAPASHTRSPTPRSRAAAGSPLVVHSVPTARPSAVGNQRLAWVGGGGWGGAPSVDGRTPLGGVSCPPTMGTPRDRARTRARPQHRGAISCAPAMDGPALESWAGQAPAPCRGRALRGRGKDCVRAPVEGPRTRVAELTPCLGAPIVAASHSRVN